MALIGNGSILHKSPGRFLSGTAGTLRSGFNKPGMLAGRFEQMDALSAGLPSGHLSPSAWSLPRRPGGLSSFVGFSVNTELAASLAAGYAADAQIDIEVTFDLTLQLQAILTGVIAAEGLLSGDVSGLAPIAGTIAGQSDWSGVLTALAGLTGQIDAEGSFAGEVVAVASMTGSIAAESAWFGDLVPLAILTGSLAAQSAWNGDLASGYGFDGAIAADSAWSGDGSALAYVAGTLPVEAALSMVSSAKAYVSGLITPETAAEELTADAVAAAVWAYAVRTLTGAGTLTPDQEAQLFELWQLAGLDPTAPVTATKTRRYAGDSVTPDIDQTITGNGRTTSTITRT